MRIVHRTPSGDRIVEIDINDPTRSVGDLLVAIGSTRTDVVIDGVAVTADCPLSAVTMCEGSVVNETAGPSATTTSGRMLTIVGGVRAGVAVGVAGPMTVGRARHCDLQIDDPALSRGHVRITAAGVCDLGSRNGSSVEGHAVHGEAALVPGATIRAGATRLSIRSAIDDRPAAVVSALGAVGGTIPFNRPPRVEPPAEAPALIVPAVPPESPASEPLSAAGIVLPVIVGAIVAVLFSPLMAVFAALGPVLTVGTWWERRRRSRRTHRASMAAFAVELARVSAVLPSRRLAEIARRRTLHPDPGEVVRRAVAPSVRCWERRPTHADAFVVGLGGVDEPFHIPLLAAAGDGVDGVAPEVVALVAAQPVMPDVPIPIDLCAGHVLGIVGDRLASQALARSLVLQMATHHGPADLAVVVAADHPGPWEWCRWLPHTSDQASGRRGAHVLHTGDVVAADAIVASGSERTVLAVLDGDDPFQGRATVGRRLLQGTHTAAVVLVADAHRLPAGCDTVVSVDEMGWIQVVDPRRAGLGRRALAWGLGPDVAMRAARRLARLDDPELPLVGAGVPAGASLLGLLGISGDDPDEIEARWVRADGTADLATPIGADADGPVVLDFVADGPHVLVAGTTGSGKSELLRSLVAGVAATASPDQVAVVLVDYKGGAAFDCCADLPHIAGLVTDLDDTLAARALRCLEAELRYREERLREVGADNLTAFRVAVAGRTQVDALPRLLVVVDEFASLAADLPEFLGALVGIAQRGRSLGVHMVLATQRPAGVITDEIRANTGCRIALRVTDRRDSVDVVDSGDAAAIARDRPGRAVARFGPAELVPFQSALSTGHSSSGAGLSVLGSNSLGVAPAGPSDLQRLVRTVSDANRRRGGRRPRSPWPPELPDRIGRVDTDGDDPCSPGGDRWLLVDEPDLQRQSFSGWGPGDGHLVVIGGPGAGATTTLATAVLATTRGWGLAAPHVHVIDLDAGRLAPLAELPAVGTYAGPTDSARRDRLVRWLDEEIGRRRGSSDVASPPILFVVDDLGGLARAHDPVRDAVIHDRFGRIWADGPAVGVTAAVSIRRSADLAPPLASRVGTVLLHRTADQSDGLRFSLKASTARFVPGRAVRSVDGATVQVVMEAPSVEEAVAERIDDVPPDLRPHDVGELRAEILWVDLEPAVTFGPDGVEIEIGVRDRDLAGAVLRLHRGEHALVIGPPRSGRTNTLAVIARAATAAAVVVGDGELARRSGLTPVTPADLGACLAQRQRALVLIDDCLDVDDPSGTLAALVASPPPGVHVIAATRPDRYRGAYMHWAADLRTSRVGLLLRPDPIDGDLLGQQLPARLMLPALPGRGIVVVDGAQEIVQVAWAGPQSSAG